VRAPKNFHIEEPDVDSESIRATHRSYWIKTAKDQDDEGEEEGSREEGPGEEGRQEGEEEVAIECIL
jgi:hypothetical protein